MDIVQVVATLILGGGSTSLLVVLGRGLFRHISGRSGRQRTASRLRMRDVDEEMRYRQALSDYASTLRGIMLEHGLGHLVPTVAGGPPHPREGRLHTMSDNENTSSTFDTASSTQLGGALYGTAEAVVPPLPVTSNAKAIVGAVASGITGAAAALTTALADSVITGGEWITVVLGGLVAAGIVGQGVYQTANKRVG